MINARNQPFCKNYKISISCFDGSRTNPRNNLEGKIALHMYKNYFCLLWKSNGIKFNKPTEELKVNFKSFDNIISDKHVKTFNKYESKP